MFLDKHVYCICAGKETYSVLEQLGGLFSVFTLCKCCRSSLTIMLGKGGPPEIKNNVIKSFKQLRNMIIFFHINGTLQL